MDRAADVLNDARRRGVSLWAEEGRLRYRAPSGILTPEDLRTFADAKVQLISLLEHRTSGHEDALCPVPRRMSGELLPLSWSQQLHWNDLPLGPGRSFRQVASAIRLEGPLDVETLRRAVREVVRHHEALRTQIVVSQGRPFQVVRATSNTALDLVDLMGEPRALRELSVQRIVSEQILQAVDLARDALCRTTLFKLANAEYALAVAMEHMISDAFSMSIVLRDICTAYAQLSKAKPVSLPAVAAQFADYALWQHRTQQSRSVAHGHYWQEALLKHSRGAWPYEAPSNASPTDGWYSVPVRINAALLRELRRWCRSVRTTLPMALFAAYALLVMRWCRVSGTVIPYQSSGRTMRGVENTVGYLASPLYVPVSRRVGESFSELLNRVTEAYCTAQEYADFSYLATQTPRPEFTRNGMFNWVPNDSPSVLIEPLHSVRVSPMALDNPILQRFTYDLEPGVLLFEHPDEIVGAVQFSAARYPTAAAKRFAEDYLQLVSGILRSSE